MKNHEVMLNLHGVGRGRENVLVKIGLIRSQIHFNPFFIFPLSYRMVNGLVYYGVALAADDLGGNMYRDYILASLVEFPAVVAAIYLCNK